MTRILYHCLITKKEELKIYYLSDVFINIYVDRLKIYKLAKLIEIDSDFV